MNRRQFLRLIGAAAGTALTGNAFATEITAGGQEFVGVLTDTTLCIGCRECERACAETHGLPVPDDIGDPGVFESLRATSETQRTVVNRFRTEQGDVFVKRQCMHCWQPACTSACLTQAMYKTREGPVIWRSSKCMGCRFCMVSCPFVIPKFEYDEWNPDIQKCDMCFERQRAGKLPACVEACPMQAMIFAGKAKLMDLARTRIYRNPTRYIHHVYGESEVGGTSWLYLSAAPFDQIGFRTDLGNSPLPMVTKEFLYAVPGVFLLVPALLVGLNILTARKSGDAREATDE